MRFDFYLSIIPCRFAHLGLIFEQEGGGKIRLRAGRLRRDDCPQLERVTSESRGDSLSVCIFIGVHLCRLVVVVLLICLSSL
jgi:hypothetical protein